MWRRSTSWMRCKLMDRTLHENTNMEEAFIQQEKIERTMITAFGNNINTTLLARLMFFKQIPSKYAPIRLQYQIAKAIYK